MGETPDGVNQSAFTNAGPGHNQPKEVVWERWQKKRTFVRALEGTYGELQQGLMDQPRVYKSTDWQWKGGPQFFDKPISHSRLKHTFHALLPVELASAMGI